MKKQKPLYRQILKEAWQMTWRYKRLWLLGFFATFLQTSGVIEMILRAFDRTNAGGWTLEHFVGGAYPGASFVGAFAAFGGPQSGVDPSGFLILLVLIAIFVALLWFVSASEGALIAAASAKGRAVPKLDVAFRRGRAFGWQIAGIHVLSKLLIGLFFMLTSLPLLAASLEASPQNVLLYFISFLIFFPLVLITSFITIYAVCGVVLHKHTFFQSIEEAWLLFKNHWLISLETAVILFGVSLLGGIVAAVAALLLIVPFFLLIFAAVLAGMSTFVGVAATVLLVLIAALTLFVGTIVTTFQLITWMRLFGRLRAHGGLPKLVRILRAIPKLLMHRS